ncbi:hypothetical protein KXW16_005579 [Aspergillus fumigatus]|nr:hypothetical protein KXW16_005579 [Aspergillus fumigatus]
MADGTDPDVSKLTDGRPVTSRMPGIRHTNTNLTVETEYMLMVLELENIHWSYNFLSSFASWVLLAGYLVIPGTFTTLQKSENLKSGLQDGRAGKAILSTIQNPPLAKPAERLRWASHHTYKYLYFKGRELVDYGPADSHSDSVISNDFFSLGRLL